MKITFTAIESAKVSCDLDGFVAVTVDIPDFEVGRLLKKLKGEAEKQPPRIPAEVRDELKDDVDVYGNAFALFSRGEWRRLDPLKVKLDLREKETARREGDDASRKKCLHCGGSGVEVGFPDDDAPNPPPCPCCKGTGEIPKEGPIDGPTDEP